LPASLYHAFFIFSFSKWWNVGLTIKTYENALILLQISSSSRVNPRLGHCCLQKSAPCISVQRSMTGRAPCIHNMVDNWRWIMIVKLWTGNGLAEQTQNRINMNIISFRNPFSFYLFVIDHYPLPFVLWQSIAIILVFINEMQSLSFKWLLSLRKIALAEYQPICYWVDRPLYCTSCRAHIIVYVVTTCI